MEKGIIAAAAALVVIPTSIWLYASDHPLKLFHSQPRCDSAEAVATIKSMALEKINDGYLGEKFISFYSRQYLGKHAVPRTKDARGLYVSPKMGDPFSIEEVTMDSFRSRGNIGTGLRCAAQMGVETSGKRAPSEFSVEYTIEPTTDGKTMVSARFLPPSL